LSSSDSSIDPLKVIGTGATELRTVFSATDLPFILRAYVNGIQTAFIVAIALACACTLVAFGGKWEKLQPAPKPEEADGAESSTKTIEGEAAV
jgi:hypothetical protein